MKHEISKDRKTLTITCSPETREELGRLFEENSGFSSEDEGDQLDGLIGNSDLQWIDPSDTGDLTDAPLLGITGGTVSEEERKEHPPCIGWISAGFWNDQKHYFPIFERWGYSRYETRSFLQDLMETGKTEFTNNW